MNIYSSVAWLHHEIDQEFKLNGLIHQKPRNHMSRFLHSNVTFVNLSAGPIVPSHPHTPHRVTCTFIQHVNILSDIKTVRHFN